MKTTKTSTATVGLLITVKSDREYFHISLTPVYIGATPADLANQTAEEIAAQRIPAERIRNVSGYDNSWQGKVSLADLAISCQGNNDRRDSLYAFRASYTPYSLSRSDDAMRIAKSLTAIEKGLEKFYQEEGHVNGFAQYARRLAKIIGATKFVSVSTKRGWSHDENGHRIMDIADGVYKLHALETEWKEAGQPAALQA